MGEMSLLHGFVPSCIVGVLCHALVVSQFEFPSINSTIQSKLRHYPRFPVLDNIPRLQ